ncbi:hypothetical protein CsatB_021623 [Cannabis sativa]
MLSLMLETFGKSSAMLTSLFLVYTTFTRFVPHEIQLYVHTFTNKMMSLIFPYVKISFHEYSGDSFMRSQLYENIQTYLSVNSTTLAQKLKASDVKDSKSMVLSLDDNSQVPDQFKGVKLKWISHKIDPTASSLRWGYPNSDDKRYFTLSFHRRHRELITTAYLRHVLEEGKRIALKNRKRKLYTNGSTDIYRSGKSSKWISVDFEHPASFETLALDPKLKKDIMKDLLKFKNGKDYYTKVGKPWKRGYLLYGPPGTGKSTMISAMANFLDYDVYDLELTSVKDNTELRKLLIDSSSKSIIVIEDIDCSLDLTGQRKKKNKKKKDGEQSSNSSDPVNDDSIDDYSKVTLSGLLNFVDGIWSACGGERLIVFTTNYFDKLDPALIRRGRMDKHIELSYCGFGAFKVLAKNYLDVESHHLFSKIECLLGETEMTPADVAENLMVNSEEEDSDECMKNLVEALEKAKKIKAKEEEEKLLEKEKEGILGTKDAVKCNGLINSIEEEGG